MRKTIILGTRGSPLALCQTEQVRNILVEKISGLTVEIRVVKTEGDRNPDIPLTAFEGRGAFVRSLELALKNREIDAAVHSLKDLPSSLPEGLVLCASPVREDPRDVLVTGDGATLKTLPNGSVIGTGSERRRIQLREIRPDLVFRPIRGNIETRLAKLGGGKYDGILIAAAAMKRLGLSQSITEYIDDEHYIPAPCQGALGVECRADDRILLHIMSQIDDLDIRLCVDMERLFIATLGLGCHTPVGAYAFLERGGMVFKAFVSFGEGKILRKTIRAPKGSMEKLVRELAVEYRVILNKAR